MVRAVSIRRSLLRNLVVIIALLGGMILLATFATARRATSTLATSLIAQALDLVEARLEGFFDPVTAELKMARRWGEAGVLDIEDPAKLNRMLAPVIREHAQVSSLLVADDRGREHMLLYSGGRWRNRQTRRDLWGYRTTWLEWSDDPAHPITYDKDMPDYDPRGRIWYYGAIETQHQLGYHLDASSVDEQIHWAGPYLFRTTQEPGITASITFDLGDGIPRVIGFDVLLKDISKFTSSLRVGRTGGAMVLTETGQLIGLPFNERFARPEDQVAALLKRPDELNWALGTAATKAFTSQPLDDPSPVRFTSEGRAYWGHGRPFQLGSSGHLWIGVVVPETDLLGNVMRVRFWVICISLTVLVGGIVRAAIMARRFSEPIEQLVDQSDRISRGDLEPSPMPNTPIKEVHALTEAHERMRAALQAFLRLRGEVRIARQIQQNALPMQLPTLAGFDIDGWCEPAEETGGDSYDIVGLQRGDNGEPILVDEGQADQAVLLLADATGHGVGPALSVTQIHAMLRMAIHLGADLTTIARHMNEQLCTDLPEGRFVTAWFALLDVQSRRLTAFSAGQGPIVRYIAADDRFDIAYADALPLGVEADLDLVLPPPITLEPGDLVIAMTDGIYESFDPQGQMFGIDRLLEVIRRQREQSATRIIAAVKSRLRDFCDSTAANDDRTMIVVRCVR